MHVHALNFRLLLRFLVLLLLALLLFLAASFAYLQTHGQTLMEKYLGEAATKSGLTISVGSTQVSLLPRPALTVKDMRVTGVGWHFSVKDATVMPDLPSLLRGVLRPHNVTLQEPRVHGVLPIPLSTVLTSLTYGGDKAPAARAHGTKLSLMAQPWMASTVAGLLPVSYTLHLAGGEVDITGENAQRLTISGLRCDVQVEDNVQLSAGIFWDFGLCAVGNGPVTRLNNVSLEGETDLTDPWKRTPKLTLRAVVQRSDWLAQCNAVFHVSLDDQQQRLKLQLTGALRKDGLLIPASLEGTAFRLDKATHIQLEPLHLGLGQDSGTFNGTLRLEGQEAFALDGHLKVQRISLTQWLGFARNLPPGLQHSLDALTDGDFTLSLDSQGLRVPHIAVTASGSRFVGSGGVASWTQPVVALDIMAPVVNLGRALPEAIGILPKAPQYGHEAFTPRPGNPVKPSEINVGYDIRLGANVIQYGSLVINNGRVIIKPGLVDAGTRLEDTVLLVQGTLYGGIVKGETILGGSPDTPYAIRLRAQHVDCGPLARALLVMPVTSGRLHANVDIWSQGKELQVFLNKLRGTVSVYAEKGSLRRVGKGSAVAFRKLDVGFKAHTGFWKQGCLGLNGQWTAALSDNGLDAQANLLGTLWFGGTGGQLAFQQLPGSLSLRVSPERSEMPSGIQVQASGKFGFHAANGKCFLNEGRLTALGVETRGNISIGMDKEGYVCQGKASLSVPDTAKTLRLMGMRYRPLPKAFSHLTLYTSFKGNAASLTLSDVRTRVDQTDVSGSLILKWNKIPELRFHMSIPQIDLDRYLPRRKESPARSRKTPSSSTPSNNATWDMRFLRHCIARGEIEAAQVTLWRMRIRNARLTANLAQGLCDLESRNATMYDGALSIKASVHCERGLFIKSALVAEGLDLAAASRDLRGDAILGGRGTFKAELQANLTGPGQLPARLNGTWRFRVDKGYHQACDAHGVLKGKPTRFETARASGILMDGLIKSSQLQLKGDDLQVTGGGWINLVNDTLDGSFTVSKKNFPDFPLRIYGTLDNMKTSIGAGKLLLNTLSGIAGGVGNMLGGLLEGVWKIFKR